MTVNFTQDEMKKFILKNEQYQITTVKYIHTYTEYHNRVVEEERSVEIAYPSDIDIEKKNRKRPQHPVRYEPKTQDYAAFALPLCFAKSCFPHRMPL